MRPILLLLAAIFASAVLLAEVHSAPVNDDFANATALTGPNIVLNASNVGATKEVGEPSHFASYPGGASVWYSWTAPFSGGATITGQGDGFAQVLAAYTGEQLSGLTWIASDAALAGQVPRITFAASAGTTYRIVVDGAGAEDRGNTILNLSIVPPPSNDDFAGAAVLTGTSIVTNGSTLGATSELQEPNHAFENADASVWYSWTAPFTGQVTLSTAGSAVLTTFSVYQGDALPSLMPVASARTGLDARTAFTAVIGTTYRIALAGNHHRGWVGKITLHLSLAHFPANDNFADRIHLAGTGLTAAGSNVGATREAGEPNHAFGDVGTASVWYSWTAPFDGGVLVSTAGSMACTVLAVYTGDSFPLSSVGRGDGALFGGTSRISFSASAGTTYQIAVADCLVSAGDFVVRFAYLPTVEITVPSDRKLTLTNSPLTITATGSALGGTITNLTIYLDGTNKLHETTGGMASVAWAAPSLGRHLFSAVAWDSYGLGATSAPVAIWAIPIIGIGELDSFTATTNEDNTVGFAASVRVSNLGSVPSSPIRLRAVAIAGYSYVEKYNPPASVPQDRELGVYYFPTPQLPANSHSAINFEVACPSPEYAGGTFGFGWGVFLVLEESFGGVWFPVERRLIGLGVWPIVNGFQGPGGGVIRVDPADGEAFCAMDVKSVVIEGPDTVFEGTTNAYWATVCYKARVEDTCKPDMLCLQFTNTSWTASRFAITTNGIFAAGRVDRDAEIQLVFPYEHKGTNGQGTKRVTIVDLPPTLERAQRRNGLLDFTLRGWPQTPHVIDSATSLNAPIEWRPLMTNQTGADGTWQFLDPRLTTLPSRFYRAREAN